MKFQCKVGKDWAEAIYDFVTSDLTFVAGFCFGVLQSIVRQDNQHQENQLDPHSKTATEVIIWFFKKLRTQQSPCSTSKPWLLLIHEKPNIILVSPK